MAQSSGLLVCEMFLMHEERRQENKRSPEALIFLAALHNVHPKDTAAFLLFAAELTLTYSAGGEERIAYTGAADFEHLLFKCFNFQNFIAYDVNQETARIDSASAA